MKHSFVLANVAWLLAAPAIVPPCRAQEAHSSLPSFQSRFAAGAGLEPVPTVCTLSDRSNEHNCSTVGDSASRSPSATSGRVPADVDFMRGGTWKQLFSDILEDQTTVLRYSLQVARGHHWRPVLAVAGATAGLIALDPHDTPPLQGSRWRSCRLLSTW
jgi:hypothetical protein